MVIQIGALKSGRDRDVEDDIRAIVDVAHANGAIVKVIFENAYLTDAEKIRACHLTEAAGGDFVKTSTGFAPSGATHDDLRLMRANTSPHIQVKAAGGVRTLDALLARHGAGRHPHRRDGDRDDHPGLPRPQGRRVADGRRDQRRERLLMTAGRARKRACPAAPIMRCVMDAKRSGCATPGEPGPARRERPA